MRSAPASAASPGRWLFGALIDTGSRTSVFGGYLLGAVLMIAAAGVDVALGRRGRAQAAGAGRAAAGVYGLEPCPRKSAEISACDGIGPPSSS